MPESSPVIIRQTVYSVVAPASKLPSSKQLSASRLIPSLSACLLIFVCCAAAWICSLRLIVYPFENWIFAQGIQGRSNLGFFDYVRSAMVVENGRNHPPAAGAREVLGRVSISRLGISEVIREGMGVGGKLGAIHPSFTSLPGARGHCVLIAGADARWRELNGVRCGDTITFRSGLTQALEYRVVATTVGTPSDLTILAANGGSLVIAAGRTQRIAKLLTLISPFPFAATGYAPKRLVVEAVLVEPPTVPAAAAPAAEVSHLVNKPLSPVPAIARRHHRVKPSFIHPGSTPQANTVQKRKLWRRLLHRN